MMDDPQLPATNQTDSNPARLELARRPGDPGEDVRRLRDRVLRDETRLLPDADIAPADDTAGIHLCLYCDGRLAGAVLGVPADDSSFASRTGIPPSQLTDVYYVTRLVVAPEYRNRGVAILLVYAVLRESRILGRSVAVFFNADDPFAQRLTQAQPIRAVPPLSFTGHQGHTYELHAMQVDVSYAMSRCWGRLRGGLRELAADRLLADEAVRTVLEQTARFYENPWFDAVRAGTLTRGQYLKFLANAHQFVRWTTRILARVAGLADDARLRRHYLRHLQGEIDHELFIERDLAYLEADVSYVREYMAPSVDIGHFMGVQESVVGFRADPRLLLAVPLAIESLTAHAPPWLLPELETCVRQWGYDDPSRATAYLRSHIPLDGGVDGHWAATSRIVAEVLKNDSDTQRFVGVIRMVLVALDRAFRSYALHPAWA
jgi:GNAT superfamily N-acetyltransferase